MESEWKDTAALEVSAIVERARDELRVLAGNPPDFDALMASTRTPGQARGSTQAHYESHYAIARGLCDRGDFEQALPVALHLVANECQDPRFFFLAGSCLQRRGTPMEAVPMYAMCIQRQPLHVAALFRMGESMDAAGAPAGQVLGIMEQVFEMARGNEALRGIQGMAEASIERLRAARKGGRHVD